MASRLVHVCDVYDALSTTRVREMAVGQTMLYLEDRGDAEFRSQACERVHSYALRQGQAQVRVLSDEQQT